MASATIVPTSGETAARGGKYLTFFLGNEEYGVEILKVREIIGLMPITRVPRTPEAVCGLINLRGKVIPVIDLRLKFGLNAADHGQRTCIIVVQAAGVEFGVVIDRVSEVANVADADIENTPAFGADIDTDYLLGIAKSGGRVKLLLDIDRVLSRKELAQLSDVTTNQEAA